MAIHKIWLTLPDGADVFVGELAFGLLKPDGTCPSSFRYTDEWLRTGFPIDPESLPLRRGEFQSSHLAPPLAVLDDALPDDWGRHLIDLKNRLPISQRTPERYILETGRHALGAIGFGMPVRDIDSADDVTLAELMAAAHDVERNIDGGNLAALRRLFATGTSPGGARPKVLLTAHGKRWIAKFPSVNRDGALDVPALEYVAMRLAEAAGLKPPPVKLEKMGGKNVLLIERFDCTEHGRIHQLSLKTLCKEGAGQYVQSYDDLFAVVVRHSARPKEDAERLFRQMVFNAAIGNTDDHLKNFMMQGMPAGYRLSPPFDLVPDIARNIEHTLAMGNSRIASVQGITRVANRWLPGGEMTAIVGDVVAAVGRFEQSITPHITDHLAHRRILDDIANRCLVLSGAANRPNADA